MNHKQLLFPLAADLIWKQDHTGWRMWTHWPIAEQAYLHYVKLFGKAQSLERLAERGGFTVKELDGLLGGWESHWLIIGQPPKNEDSIYAANNCDCDRCGFEYRKHPSSPYYLDRNNEPYLTRLCDGRLVKL